MLKKSNILKESPQFHMSGFFTSEGGLLQKALSFQEFNHRYQTFECSIASIHVNTCRVITTIGLAFNFTTNCQNKFEILTNNFI